MYAAALQTQNAETAYMKSRQLLHVGLYGSICTMI